VIGPPGPDRFINVGRVTNLPPMVSVPFGGVRLVSRGPQVVVPPFLALPADVPVRHARRRFPALLGL
jgi:hypothetical protein